MNTREFIPAAEGHPKPKGRIAFQAVKLYERFTQAELCALMRELQADPANRAPAGSIRMYTKSCDRKTDEIARAISWTIADHRAAAGNPLGWEAGAGYSGRQTNKRR